MGFFDDVLNKTKETVDIVGKKTGEAVNVQKLKFDISSIETKREKDFATLGKLCFAELKNSSDIAPEVKEVIKSIDLKGEKINALNFELAKFQNRRFCAKCGAPIDVSSNFCRVCGAKVTFVNNDQQGDKTEN